MPIRKDGTGKRWVEMEFLAPGTPEEIWQAMATGPGNATWFTRATIEERVGGALRLYFGPDVSTNGEVTIWQPPHRFGYVERDWDRDAPPVATEIEITSRSGGVCVVRMVHSMFSVSDDWDDQMESFEGGWPGFFAVLRLYLRHFAGKKGASFQAMASTESDHLAVWSRLTTLLDLAGASVGQQRRTPEVPESLAGVVEETHQDATVRWLLMRLAAPMPGVALVGTYGAKQAVNVSVSLFLYGDGAEGASAASEPRWQDWLRETFPVRPDISGGQTAS